MGFASSRGTATSRQIGKIRGLAAAIGEGPTLVLALARDARVASMRIDPKLVGHPVTDDIAELSMFEASSIIRTLSEACAERDGERAGPAPVSADPPEPGHGPACLVGQGCRGAVLRRHDGADLCWLHWTHPDVPEARRVG